MALEVEGGGRGRGHALYDAPQRAIDVGHGRVRSHWCQTKMGPERVQVRMTWGVMPDSMREALPGAAAAAAARRIEEREESRSSRRK